MARRVQLNFNTQPSQPPQANERRRTSDQTGAQNESEGINYEYYYSNTAASGTSNNNYTTYEPQSNNYTNYNNNDSNNYNYNYNENNNNYQDTAVNYEYEATAYADSNVNYYYETGNGNVNGNGNANVNLNRIGSANGHYNSNFTQNHTHPVSKTSFPVVHPPPLVQTANSPKNFNSQYSYGSSKDKSWIKAFSSGGFENELPLLEGKYKLLHSFTFIYLFIYLFIYYRIGYQFF